LGDALVGAFGADEMGQASGAVYLFTGTAMGAELQVSDATATLVGEAVGDEFGIGVSLRGDFDGDGLSDAVIGARSSDGDGDDAGRAYVFFGADIATGGVFDATDAGATLTGEAPGDLAAQAVVPVGDVDGDGLDDLLVGAHLNADGGGQAGKSYLVLGSQLTGELSLADAHAVFVGEVAGDNSGTALASLGDLDLDGRDEVLIGAKYHDALGANTGRAYLFFGSTLATGGTFDLSSADIMFTGEAEGDECGRAVGLAGDVDGDGLPDLLLGAVYNDDGGNGSGKAYVFLGSSLLDAAQRSCGDADAAFAGEASGDRTGQPVTGVGDLNNDGIDDLLIGAAFSDAGGPNAGKVFIVMGGP